MGGEVFLEFVSDDAIAVFGIIEKVSPLLFNYCDVLLWVSRKEVSNVSKT